MDRPLSSHHWLLAIRPKTLTLAIVPVAMGAAISDVEFGLLQWPPLLAILLAALLIQVGTNLYNDAGDALRGADGPQRLGPQRVVASGWLSVAAVQRAAVGSFSAALLLGLYLVQLGGWPVVLIGLLSVAAGVGYTAGRTPIAYTFLGELFVFLFFGVIAVSGTVWILSQQWSAAALWAGSAVGLIAAAVLVVNNYRDIDTDRPAGKHTLAVYLGRQWTRHLYLLLLLLPFVLLLAVVDLLQRPQLLWSVWLLLPYALYLGWSVYRTPHGVQLNRLLVQTAQLQLLFGGLFIVGVYQ
jgi:1,4-dihydroxy-2-naphthoate octaprenyltransferase